jgi:NAD(P)-dependent dehydrogenase (short-subunit alcohol dehydrogenase family)
MSVNLRGPFFLTQEVVRRMLAVPVSNHPRSIISLSSMNAFVAAPEWAEYCLSKAGVSMMTRLYALRLADSGIGVFEIRPGLASISARSIGSSGKAAIWAGSRTTLSSTARLPSASAPPAYRSKAIGKLPAPASLPISSASRGLNGSASKQIAPFAAATMPLFLWSEVCRMTLKTLG